MKIYRIFTLCKYKIALRVITLIYSPALIAASEIEFMNENLYHAHYEHHFTRRIPFYANNQFSFISNTHNKLAFVEHTNAQKPEREIEKTSREPDEIN